MKTRPTTRRLLTASATALCALTVLSARIHASPPQYTVTVLGNLPGGPGSAAYGINDSGQVAGSSNTAATQFGSSIPHAVVWNGTTPTDIGGFFGGRRSFAYGISDSGGAVGYSIVSNNPSVYDAFRIGPGYSGSLGRIDGSGGSSAGSINMAYGINDSGQVAGFASTPGQAALHAVRWTGGTPTDLGTLGGTSSEGTGINASGQVVGSSQITGNSAYRAVVWNGTTPTSLGTLGGTTSSRGSGINASGQVAGWSNYPGGAAYNYHAVVWNGTTPTDLGTLGGDSSKAMSINDSGDVVGMSATTGNTSNHPFLYTDGTMYDLYSLLLPGSGVTSLSIFANNSTYAFGGFNGFEDVGGGGDAINDLGQIVATSNLGPVILTPVATPEPASAVLLLGGGALLALLRRRSPVGA